MQGESGSSDELVMQLVESALSRPATERARFVESACGANLALCKEVLERVRWEEQMGSFLRQPVLKRDAPPAISSKPVPWLPAVVSVVCLVTAFFVFPATPVSTGPPARLAILPSPVPWINGTLIELAQRLQGVREGLFVLSPEDLADARADTPEGARSALSATHVLSVTVTDNSVRALLIDAGTNQTLSEWAGKKQELAGGLEGLVKSAFRVSGMESHRGGPAWSDYVEGLGRPHGKPFFREAIAKDPRWALPGVRLAESLLRDHRPDQAAEEATQARSLRGGRVAALLVSGSIEEASKHFPQAIAFYEQAVRIAPAHSGAWRMLARARSKAGDANAAMEAWQKALTVQPLDYQSFVDADILRAP
jgi:hypothetical protein